MIKKARVRRFQAIDDLTVKFSPRVTVIVGATDAGKSTLLRALLFAFFSKWKPAYHRHGTSTTAVDVWVDGHRVSRRKGKGVNSYTIDGKKLSAVGKGGVPEQVARLLNLTPANVQRQLDKVFWLLDSPGQVSKYLNKIVNLELIDEAWARAHAGVRTAELAAKAAKADLEQANQKLRDTEWIEDFLTAARRVVRAGERAEEAAERTARLEIPVKAARTARKAGIRLDGAVSAGSRAVAAGGKLWQTRTDLADLQSQIEQAKRLRADAALTVPDLSDLERVRAKADDVAEERRHLEYTLADARAAATEARKVREELVEAEAALTAAAKKEKKRCPKCGQPVRS
jgi:DNA repair ATPase RecN